MTSLSDLHHEWQGDLELASRGDLRLSTSSARSRQHVLRRLLTSPGDHIWDLGYGGGLGSLVGKPIDLRSIEALIRLQLRREASVAIEPPPQVTVPPVTESQYGTTMINIKYTESEAGTSVATEIPLST